MESIGLEEPMATASDEFPIGKLGGMFASVPETIAPVDPNDMSKGLRHVLSGEITVATADVEQDLGSE